MPNNEKYLNCIQIFYDIVALPNPLHWSPHKAQPSNIRHKSHDLSGQVRSFDKVNLGESELPTPWTLQSLSKLIKEKYTGVQNSLGILKMINSQLH